MKLQYIVLAVIGIAVLLYFFRSRITDLAAVGQSSTQAVQNIGQQYHSPLGFPSPTAEYADFMSQLYNAQQHPADLLNDPFIHPLPGGPPVFFGGKVWINQSGKLSAIGNYSNEGTPSQIH